MRKVNLQYSRKLENLVTLQTLCYWLFKGGLYIIIFAKHVEGHFTVISNVLTESKFQMRATC